ncbi:MAG: endonuclease NucS [Chloroflexota bacterium]|nr:endonuclease NucS [Chloroflexota bacterium]
MTELHIKEFLTRFSVDELTSEGILREGSLFLSNLSVEPLINWMNTHEVTRLYATEGDWFLTSEGEFQNPYSTEAKSGKVEKLNTLGNVFFRQNPTLNPYYVASPAPETTRHVPETDIEDPSDEARFRLERDLQKALRSNIQQLEAGLKIIDGGSEQSVGTGRIDITAKDSEGCLVVIELKAGRANLAAIGQLLSYMGSEISEQCSAVRGILIASDFDPRLVAAAKAVPNVSLVAYSHQFSFREV